MNVEALDSCERRKQSLANVIYILRYIVGGFDDLGLIIS